MSEPERGTPQEGTPTDQPRPDETRPDQRRRGESGAVPDLASADTTDLSGTVAALTSEDLEPTERRRLLGRLANQLRLRGVADLFRPRAAMRWIADTVGDLAPHVPVRDLATLQRHFPGLDREALADRLVRNAARSTAAVGAAGGGVAAVEWVATPALLSAPVLLAAETVVVVAIEVKLIGELHEVYGQPVQGTGTQRGLALVQSWAQRRGVNPLVPGAGVTAVLGTAVRRELRDRLLRRFGRNLTTYGPMLTGAAVASYLNRRATVALAQHVRRDLAERPAPARLSGSAHPERPGGSTAISRWPTAPPVQSRPADADRQPGAAPPQADPGAGR
jgi:hypothetical protein